GPKKANKAESLPWPAQSTEATGDGAKALAANAKGTKQYRAQKRLFDAARHRLETRVQAATAGSARLAPSPLTVEEQWLALYLIALQAAQRADSATETAEGGLDFWNALKLAQMQDYNAAA